MRWRTEFTGRNYDKRSRWSERTARQLDAVLSLTPRREPPELPPPPLVLLPPLPPPPPPRTTAQLIQDALAQREPLTIHELVAITGREKGTVYATVREEMSLGHLVRGKLETYAGQMRNHFARSREAFTPPEVLAPPALDDVTGFWEESGEGYLPVSAKFLGSPRVLREAYEATIERPFCNEGTKPWLMTHRRHAYFEVDEWSDPDAMEWLEL